MTTATKTPGKPKRKPAARTAAKTAAVKKTPAKKTTAKKTAAKKTTARKPAAKKTAPKPAAKPAPAAKKPAAPKLAKPAKAPSALAVATESAATHRLAKVKAWETNRPGRLRATECGVPKKFATVLGVKPGESVTLGLEAFAGYTFERNTGAKVADRLDDTQIGELFATMFPHRKGYHGSAGKSWSPELVQEFRARYNRGDFTNRAKPGQKGAAEALPFSQRWTGDGWLTVRRGRKLGSTSKMKPKDDGVPKTKGFGNRKATGAKASPKPAAKKAAKKPAKKPVRKATVKRTVKKAAKRTAAKKPGRKPAARKAVRRKPVAKPAAK